MLILLGCSKKEVESEPANSGAFIDSENSQREKDSYLSYEHYFTIDTTDENLPKSYKNTLDSCIENVKDNCSILDSRITTGENPSAYIKLRMKSDGIKALLNVASTSGKVVQESTHVEDLAKPIVDNNQHLAMLKNYRDQLISLQKKASDDIDALIKVSSELSKIQSEIEIALGEKEFLLQRVNLDIVNINFQVEYYRSFWRPIRESLSDFSNNLSDGISGTIIVVAYLLPAIMVFILLFVGVRFVRRKMRNK